MRYLLFLKVILSGCFNVFSQVPPFIATDLESNGQGYYFITPWSLQAGPDIPERAMILDGEGHVVYHQEIPFVSNFRVWPDGRMSYASAGKHRFMDSTFTVIDSVTCLNGIFTDLHDIQILSDGNYLLLGAENVIMDLSAYAYFQPNNSPGSTTAIVKCGVLQELDADKNLLWEWRMADHIDFLATDTTRLNNPNNVDWSHCNAVELDQDGNVLISSRHFNSITKVDRMADTVMWHLGGSLNDFQFMNDPGFYLQHDIRRLPNGNISLFDNSKAGAHAGRGVEYVLDEENYTATSVWSRSHSDTSFSRSRGSMQRLSNGNSLIGWGVLDPDNVMFSVYGPDGSSVCELHFPDTLISYRAYFFDDLPFGLDRPLITCSVMDDDYMLLAEHVTNEFVWSTGESGPTIVVGALDTVYVEVPVGSGGSLRSEPFVVADNCLSTGVESSAGILRTAVYPNPAGSSIHLRNGSKELGRVEIVDAMGRLLWSMNSSESDIDISLTGIGPGVYFIRTGNGVYRFVKNH